MARGTSALIGWLGLITIVMAGVFSAVIIAASLTPADDKGARPDYWHQIYNTLASVTGFDGFDTSWWFTLVMFLIALGGLFIVSSLIGVLVSGFEAKVEELRKGRSLVVETGHTLILGWSEAVYTLISELAIANESERDSVVVILADEDKVEMEERLAAKVEDTGRMRVVCRSGSPIDLADLAIANPNAARSIIVLAGSGDDPDIAVIKTILALTHGPDRRAEPFHIVAEIESAKNLEIAGIVGGDEATLVDKGKTISRLMVQASRQSGIAVAYSELFDFGGDEIYFRDDPALVGRTYGDALLAYENCCVIGIRSSSAARINPPLDTPIVAGDSVIAIASDDSVLATAPAFAGEVEEAAIHLTDDPTPTPTRMLMLGWNSRAHIVIEELDAYAVAGSVLKVVSESELAGEESGEAGLVPAEFVASTLND